MCKQNKQKPTIPTQILLVTHRHRNILHIVIASYHVDFPLDCTPVIMTPDIIKWIPELLT